MYVIELRYSCLHVGIDFGPLPPKKINNNQFSTLYDKFETIINVLVVIVNLVSYFTHVSKCMHQQNNITAQIQIILVLIFNKGLK